MSGGKNKGYTIIEVMIVLAVTGVMFLIAAVFISGKQGQVEFRQSVTDLDTKLQSTINDVANGFYPSSPYFTCSASNNSLPSYTSAASDNQGQNGSCIFLGKAVHFYTDDPAQGQSQYEVLTIGANRLDANGAPVTSIVGTNYAAPGGAHPKAIYNPVDLTDKNVLTNGAVFLHSHELREYITGSTVPLSIDDYGFAILTDVTQNNFGNKLTPGSRSVGLYRYDAAQALPVANSEANAANYAVSINDADRIDTVTVCVQNGSKQAYITIGGQGKLTTDITWGTCP